MKQTVSCNYPLEYMAKQKYSYNQKKIKMELFAIN